ncbi:MAG: type II toxin-antitoxin system RelE/ParE family toxin [Gemmatimonadaceae bacterium]
MDRHRLSRTCALPCSASVRLNRSSQAACDRPLWRVSYIYLYTVITHRPLLWVGSALEDLRAFPVSARRRAGHALDLLQQGITPIDCTPTPSVGRGVMELRIRAGGAFRVFFVARFKDGIYVLHAFQKKSQATARRDIELGARRYRWVLGQLTRREVGVADDH